MLPEGLARVLHQRTNGNPLFLATLVEGLVRQGVLRDGEAGWSLPGGLATVAAGVPENLRQLLTCYVEQLPTVEQTLLEAASVARREFAVAAVAAAVDWTVEDVETRCATLARRGQFLHVCGTDAWPDGPIATRYRFSHDVYRETLYEQVPCGRRARWHLQIGVRLKVGYGTRRREVAAELAEHFVRGQDTARAVQYLQYASEASPRQSSEKPQESPRASSCFVPLWVLHSSVETAKATPWGVVPGRGDQERADVHGILILAVQR